MRFSEWRGTKWILLALVGLIFEASASDKTEDFDSDPGWHGHQNRSQVPERRTVRQDFGFNRDARAGRKAGAIGGFICTAAEPAYYAKAISSSSLQDPLSASGTLVADDGAYHFLICFFNDETVNEWRTPNTIALRIQGRGKVFFAYVEYCTSDWKAGGDFPGGFSKIKDPQTGRDELRGFPTGPSIHTWSLRYDPEGNSGSGSIQVTVDEETSICHIEPSHRRSGARFNRFGLLNVIKSADGGGEVWLDDLTINGRTEHFDSDPAWTSFNNRVSYLSSNVRPRFDFGYSPTHFASGKSAGELGGIVFRGDNRYPDRLAFYGARLEQLTLEKPLQASGKVSLRRGVTDSTVLLGFFHSEQSIEVSPSQASGWPKSFLGIAVEGPSREGFFFYPACRTRNGEALSAGGDDRPRILPDGASHDWKLEYDPPAANRTGQVRVALDGKMAVLSLAPEHLQSGTILNRFGLITTWIDGNGQHIYFDELSYTWRQD